jgi:nicotinamidase-related amidase
MNTQNCQLVNRVFKVEVDDNIWKEFDSGRTALIIMDMKVDKDSPITDVVRSAKKCLYTVRWTAIRVFHILEGYESCSSDAPVDKVLLSEKKWDIHPDMYPIVGEYVVDKGAFANSKLRGQIEKLGIKYLVVVGNTADSYVSTISQNASEYDYFCFVIKNDIDANRFIKSVDANLKPIACC